MVLVTRKNVEDATVNSAKYGKIGIALAVIGIAIGIFSVVLQFR